MKKLFLLIPFLFVSNISFGAPKMDQDSMEQIVKQMAQQARGENGLVEFSFNQVTMYLISNVEYDRMRIIAPIVEYKNLSRVEIDAILESNFSKSLDARYATREGILYSAYMHRMSELSESLLISAVNQVATLAQTFGGEYSSGSLVYGGSE